MMFSGRVIYYISDGRLYLKGMMDSGVRGVRCDISPYFFIIRGDEKECAGMDGVVSIEDTDLSFRMGEGVEVCVNKVETEYPGVVAKIRDKLMKKGIMSMEADIPFIRRIEVDRRIEIKYGYENVAYLDIEVDDSRGFPSKYGEYRIECVGVMDVQGNFEWFYAGDFSDEREMLIELVDWMRKKKKSVIVGWNVQFDYNHLVERLKRMAADDDYLSFCDCIDLKGEYEFAVKGLSSYSLAEVSEYEGWRKKGREKKVSLMNSDELYSYNMYDVELLRRIDERYGFVGLRLELSNFLNLQLSELTPLRMGDTLILRRLRELGYVAKNSSNNEGSKYEGAYVMTPVPGIHRGVVVYDFEAMYPNIIINEKIDIDGFNGEVVPEVMRTILERRMEYKRLYKETGEKKYDELQKIMKPVLNCFSEDTYILTVDGVKSIGDVIYGDKVYSVNPESGEVEVDEVVKTWEYFYVGEMYSFKDGRCMDLLVTPNHRFLVETKDGDVLWMTAEEIYENRDVRIYLPKFGGEGEAVEDELEKVVCGGYWVKIDRGKVFGYRYEIDLSNVCVEKVMYFGKVYCVTTKKNHDVFAGRSGGFVLTGQSLYGIFGQPAFRYYNRHKAEMVTSNGRELIMRVIGYLKKEFGIDTIYSDTDSVFIKLGDKAGDIVAFSKVLLDCVNEYVYPYKMDLDKVFHSILFLADDNGEGIKKRYVGVTVDGEWKWRGLETRRRDICSLAKKVLRDVVEMLLLKDVGVEGVVDYLYKVKSKMFSGELDKELVITKGVKDDVNDYKANAPQKRAWERLLERGISLTENKISYVWIAGDVEPVVDESDLERLKGRLDYRYYWENQIYPPVKRILKSVVVYRQQKLL